VIDNPLEFSLKTPDLPSAMNAKIGILIRRCGLATVYADWKKLTDRWEEENNKVPSTSDSEHNVRGGKIPCLKLYYPWSPMGLDP